MAPRLIRAGLDRKPHSFTDDEYRSAAEMRQAWADPGQRAEIIVLLEDRGIAAAHQVLPDGLHQPCLCRGDRLAVPPFGSRGRRNASAFTRVSCRNNLLQNQNAGVPV